MFVYRRMVRFEEVDAAGLVFFARFVGYAHEAMEQLFAPVEGGYAGLILARRVGLPAVRVEADHPAPVRYGDTLRIETTVARLGTRSATLRYRMFRASDEVLAAEIRHTVVTTDLEKLVSCAMPADVRAVLESHVEEAAAVSTGRAGHAGGG
ncbi:acyl-CoA thioesterase [Chondromyces apiculatus]|uniref:4-hydroxybenzoyl-CoA thioesterase family protein n=1 Tax=Chondromyces apiculatus DSM 436 TaxID=1192034 RepID=A0A017SYB1_9BACT|nr:acyl-CoA thioesterase [Chondromyces apiculatus]EYF01570.1 4-hydroxybenzoyl-CoA thioesterase family protein [Chondromyces apiculatus DSM 436]